MAIVYCLSMDMIASTEAGLQMTKLRSDRFNLSFVEQIKPHLQKLGLSDGLLKFSGDGWLLMTADEEQVPRLCCLAVILAARFRDEMSEATGMVADRVPSLRLAICAGRDIRVELPDGGEDWVGDSARRATRLCQCCQPDEILTDETVKLLAFRDFRVSLADLNRRPPEYQPKRMEEPIQPYVLGELRTDAAVESGAPEYYMCIPSASSERYKRRSGLPNGWAKVWLARPGSWGRLTSRACSES
jgi:class 3 adenylate cyclase